MSDEWGEVSLSEITERVTEKNVEGIDRVFSVSAQRGLIDQEDFFNKRVASKNLANYTVVRPGTYVYNKSYSVDAPIGVVTRNRKREPGVVSPLYIAFRVTSSNLIPGFLDLAVTAPEFADSLRGLLKEGGRAHGALNVKVSDFFTARITLPPLSVQARIVDLLEHLDTLIANLEQEREAVEALLVALRRDFFEGLGEVVELSKVLDAARAGGTPDRKRKDFYGGNIPWLKSGEVNNSFIQATEESLTTEGLSNSSAWLVPGGAVVVAMYGATAATVGFTGLAMAMNQAILALTPDSSKADARFLYHWMCYHSPRLKESATGAAQPNLSKAVVLREIAFPAMSLEDQAVMSADLDAALATMDALREEVAQLRVTRSATLTSLLSREIEIPDSYDELLGAAS